MISPDLTGYVVAAAALTAIAVGLAVARKQGQYYLLLLGAMLYPFALEVGFSPGRQNSGEDLIASPRPGHLVALFLPTIVLAAAILIAAAAPRRALRLQEPTT